MAHKFLDRTSESTSATGTGNFEFAGAEQNCFAFQAGLSNGDTTDYFAIGASGEHEFGKLTYVSSGDEATRSVAGGSNGGSPVNFTQAPKVTACVGASSLKGQWVEITRTVASGAAQVDFVLPPGYDRYRIEFHSVLPAADAEIFLRTSTDGGSTFDSGASNYAYLGHHQVTTTLTAVSSTGATEFPLSMGFSVESAPTEIDGGMWGHVEIINPSAANRCQIEIKTRFERNTGALYNVKLEGHRRAAADVNAVRIAANGQNSSGTFVLLARRK